MAQTLAEQKNKSLLVRIGLGAGRVVAIFYQAGRDAIQTMIGTILPFMAFIAVWASSSECMVTKPKPRERPLSRSSITLASTTVPCSAKAEWRSPSVVLKDRLPT